MADIASSPSHKPQVAAETTAEVKHSSNAGAAALATQQKTASRKRKRRRRNAACSDDRLESPPPKQRKTGVGATSSQPVGNVKHALLAQYYPHILTLRQYVLHNLPASSRLRRRKIAELRADKELCQAPDDVRSQLCKLLDTTFVGFCAVSQQETKSQADCRLQQWIDFSQRDESLVTLKGSDASAVHLQSEIVDFVIWLLFSRSDRSNTRPHHLLCDGFRKDSTARQHGAPSPIHGLYSLYFNERVAAMKQAPWPQLLQLWGKSGEAMMINLLLDCSLFLHVDAGHGNYYQLSGDPIYEAQPLPLPETSPPIQNAHVFVERRPTDIIFVRSRMLYARAALNARGNVQFGLRHIHVLNRFPPQPRTCTDPAQDNSDCTHPIVDATHHIMMYMFPRQYNLHNVFTSHVDHTKTAQKFQDYTLREEEISSKFSKNGSEGKCQLRARVPKRLKGKAEHLVQRLQVRHSRCSYAKLLEHYCPTGPAPSQDSSKHHKLETASSSVARMPGKSAKNRKKPRPSLHNPPPRASAASLMELAVPTAQVSAFCQAVLSKIIPVDFWGAGDVQTHNRQVFLKNVDRFINLRRFEAMSLHEVVQGLKVAHIDWPSPPRVAGEQKCSHSDFRKRNEIFAEFVYYVFDSLLIPLIRSNFYVTESSAHRSRLFFFRHDVWRCIAEPAMTQIKNRMFREVQVKDALRILESRQLGYSQVRLLPKQASVRPIMNLRRRMIVRKDRNALGRSINSILGPVYSMLRLEKYLDSERLGSTMFSVGDLYERISSFKQALGPQSGPLYFAKVDVQTAFDTIPQDAVVALMQSIPSQTRYEISKHVEMTLHSSGALAGSKPLRRWHSSAKIAGDTSTFLETLSRNTMPSKKNTIYVDSVFRKGHGTRDLLSLLASHIQDNLVKIGKKYYRQKEGIPQGSVLSSVLCNYFYADLERKHLGFLQSADCLLLRLIDDFLLITTARSKASRFVTVMQAGVPEYGVTVSPPKTLVNFDLTINKMPVPTIPIGNHLFPYCGMNINTLTLELTRDRGSGGGGGGLAPATSATKDAAIANSLTVEFTRRPGANFLRKTLNAFKIQSHRMLYDSRHNSPRTVLRNLSDALVETAAKAWAYARCLAPGKQPSAAVWIRTMQDLVQVVYLLLTSRTRRKKYPGYECKVTKGQIRMVALDAFRRVLRVKQARFGAVLEWLEGEIGSLEGRGRGRKRAARQDDANMRA